MMDDDVTKGLAEDIALIKEAVRANSGFLRRILAAGAMRSVAAVIGSVSIVLALLWEGVVRHYGGLTAAPPWVRVALIGVTALTLAAVGVQKAVTFTRAAKRVDRRYTFFRFADELMDHPVFLSQGLVLLMAVLLVVAGARAGDGAWVFAAIAGGIGTVFALYAAAFLLQTYLVVTLWLYAAAAVALFAPAVPVFVLVAGGFGMGFLVFAWACRPERVQGPDH